MARPTLDALAREFAADPDATVDTVARRILDVRPDVRARSAQDAAARALGEPTVSEQVREARRADRPRRRRRRGRTVTVRRVRRSPVGGLLAQALGLILLYWLVRWGGSVAEAVDRVRRAVDWLMAPEPIP